MQLIQEFLLYTSIFLYLVMHEKTRYVCYIVIVA